jgi:hypothetical protein
MKAKLKKAVEENLLIVPKEIKKHELALKKAAGIEPKRPAAKKAGSGIAGPSGGNARSGVTPGLDRAVCRTSNGMRKGGTADFRRDPQHLFDQYRDQGDYDEMDVDDEQEMYDFDLDEGEQ